jgi:hypothetical protein
LGACSVSVSRNGATPPLNANAASALPANLRGITYDDLSSTCSATKAQLHTERLLRHPTVRIVFDRVPPACYASGVARVDRYGQTMGELIDSSAMKAYSLAQVRTRVSAYLTVLAGSVDLWEIGNEVNGEWLSGVHCPGKAECRARARDVISKVQAMYEAAARAGYATEMTLYYEPPRVATQGYQMIPWEEAYVPAAMHRGLRYVLVSYYEAANKGIRPSHSQWDAIFKKLTADFPNAKVGFGEIGLPKPIRAATLARAMNIFNYYQTMEFPDISSYTRAGFWWNAAEDLVPSDRWPSFLRDVEEKL